MKREGSLIFAAAILAFLNKSVLAVRVNNNPIQEPIFEPETIPSQGLEFMDEDGSEALYYYPNEQVFYEITSEAADDSVDAANAEE